MFGADCFPYSRNDRKRMPSAPIISRLRETISRAFFWLNNQAGSRAHD
jgi:hypothetical protein